MRLKDYDAALEREAAAFPDRAKDITAERKRIAPALAQEIARGDSPVDAESGVDVDALVAAALAETDEGTS